jgi:LmbE family N-acetylglucosaminyl deacetylase
MVPPNYQPVRLLVVLQLPEQAAANRKLALPGSNPAIDFRGTVTQAPIARTPGPTSQNVFMNLHHATSEIFIPDHQPETAALQRVTHLGIGAHQDDLEFMAFHGILNCHGRDDQWFGGVTCSNGAGSSRSGPYAGFSDEQLMEVRRNEQNTAATIGQYAAMIQLDYPSGSIKSPAGQELLEDLKTILTATRPDVVYTHNPADKHDTHIGVTVAALQAMRELPRDQRPRQVIGCEVWRDLDWLPDADKVLMDVSGGDILAAAMNGAFDSQIAGGKRYDLAILGRRAANATFFNSHATDAATQLIFGMDLTPLVMDPSTDIVSYVCDLIDQFNADVRLKLTRCLP